MRAGEWFELHGRNQASLGETSLEKKQALKQGKKYAQKELYNKEVPSDGSPQSEETTIDPPAKSECKVGKTCVCIAKSDFATYIPEWFKVGTFYHTSIVIFEETEEPKDRQYYEAFFDPSGINVVPPRSRAAHMFGAEYTAKKAGPKGLTTKIKEKMETDVHLFSHLGMANTSNTELDDCVELNIPMTLFNLTKDFSSSFALEWSYYFENKIVDPLTFYLSKWYAAGTYNLLTHNCNSFTQDAYQLLTRISVAKYSSAESGVVTGRFWVLISNLSWFFTRHSNHVEKQGLDLGRLNMDLQESMNTSIIFKDRLIKFIVRHLLDDPGKIRFLPASTKEETNIESHRQEQEQTPGCLEFFQGAVSYLTDRVQTALLHVPNHNPTPYAPL